MSFIHVSRKTSKIWVFKVITSDASNFRLFKTYACKFRKLAVGKFREIDDSSSLPT